MPIAILFISSYGVSMEIQGHRGSRGTLPENTLPGFMAAIEAGVDALELDLLTTSDGMVVIHHNFAVNGALCQYLNGNAVDSESLILATSLQDLKKLDCGSKKNSRFPSQIPIPGTQVPTLLELLDLITSSPHPNAKKVRLNLEIKRDPSAPDKTISPSAMAQKVVSLVRDHGFVDRVYYSSFDPESLMSIRKLDPTARLGFIFGEEILSQLGLEKVIAIATSLHVEILSPEHTLIKDKNDLERLQKEFKVIVWTVNEESRWRELIEMNVDGIITDYPESLLNFVEGSG